MKFEIVGRCCEEWASRDGMLKRSRYDYHLKLLESADDFLYRVGDFVTLEHTAKPDEPVNTDTQQAKAKAR